MPSQTDPHSLAETILRAAGPAIREAEAAERAQVIVWTFEQGAWDTEKAAFGIVRERLSSEGYTSYIGSEGNDGHGASDREFVVVSLLPKKQ